MKIIITGGSGYTGTLLTSELLSLGHKVMIIDTQWFGNIFKSGKNLIVKKADIRNLEGISFKGYDCVIHLANIANDPSVELSPNLSWDVNVLATKNLIEKSINDKIKQVIYASSGSVYGVKKEKNVTEDLKLVPISVYNKTKMIAERIILSYGNKIKSHIIRPATVCGYSPIMRLDVTVNMFVHQAIKNKLITIFGGQQIRPNIHINDLIDVYKHFLFKPSLPSGFYNAGFENISLIDIAKKISSITSCKIKIKKEIDVRSYKQNSDKLISTGFKPKKGVEDAIYELKSYFLNSNVKNIDKCYRVNRMKKLGLK